MKKFLFVFAAGVLLHAMAMAQTMTVSGSHVQDASGASCANCRITFAPVDLSGRPISFRIGGGGQVQSNPVSATVTNGAFTIVLPDVNATNPQNVCFKTTVVDKGSGVTVLGPLGYTCVQPSSTIGGWCDATTCNFDQFIPNVPGLPVDNLKLTTNGSSGPATYSNGILNIPQYSGGGGSMTWPTGGAGIPKYNGSSAWGTTYTAPAGAIVGTTDTQTLTNKTLDGVSPATMAFVDPTSSIQTQLNGKQAVNPMWERVGVVLAPIPADLSQQVQEISGLLSTTPEILTGCTQVFKSVFTAGWVTSTVQLWSAESCDGIHFTRAAAPIPGTVGYARSFVMPTLVSGNIVMFAVNTNNGHLDMFTGTTMAGLTVAHSNVLSCGSNGDQDASQGTFTAWITSGSNWSGLQNCHTTNNNYALWSVSSTNAGVTWTQFQTGAVIGDTGITCGGLCTDAGDRGIYYDGTAAYFWAHTGPPGILPTPYIWEFSDPTGTGHTWTAFPKPSVTAISDLEGVNLPTAGSTGPQLGDVFILPWPALGRTFMYYAAYAPGCASPTCAFPSYIEAATIPQPIASIAPVQQTDGPSTVGAPLFSVNGTPQSNQWLHNLKAGPGITLLDLGNGTVEVTLNSTYQDLATFAGSASTPLSSYTTTAGKTFVQYTAGGASPLIMPQLSGSSSELVPGAVNSFGDVLDTLTPSSADYAVSETFTLANTTDQVAVIARANSGAATFYIFLYGGSGTLAVYAVASGTPTLLMSPAFTWAAGATHTMKLQVSGTTISAFMDGSAITGSPVTDSHVSAAGQAGSRVYAGATGTNFSVQ